MKVNALSSYRISEYVFILQYIKFANTAWKTLRTVTVALFSTGSYKRFRTKFVGMFVTGFW